MAVKVQELMAHQVVTAEPHHTVMRNHRIHRVVVTDEQRVVGILSAFDLLKLVEDHRFTRKGAPTPSKRRGGKRA